MAFDYTVNSAAGLGVRQIDHGNERHDPSFLRLFRGLPRSPESRQGRLPQASVDQRALMLRPVREGEACEPRPAADAPDPRIGVRGWRSGPFFFKRPERCAERRQFACLDAAPDVVNLRMLLVPGRRGRRAYGQWEHRPHDHRIPRLTPKSKDGPLIATLSSAEVWIFFH